MVMHSLYFTHRYILKTTLNLAWSRISGIPSVCILTYHSVIYPYRLT